MKRSSAVLDVLAVGAVILGLAIAATHYYLQAIDLRSTIRHQNAEIDTRRSICDLQAKVIGAYTAELFRLGYSEQDLNRIQIGQPATARTPDAGK